MHRSESSTSQVNAALRYCFDNNVNIFGPVREIKRHFIGKMTFKTPEKKTLREKLNNNLRKHSATAKKLFQEAKNSVLRLAS